MALSAVVLPAPLGPMSPDAALFDTQIDAIQRGRRSELLAKTVRFYACHGFSAPSFGIRLGAFRAFGIQEFFSTQTQPLNGRVNPGPFLGQELLRSPRSSSARAPALINIPRPRLVSTSSSSTSC